MKKLLLMISLCVVTQAIAQEPSRSECENLMKSYFLATNVYPDTKKTTTMKQCFKLYPNLEHEDKNRKRENRTALMKSVLNHNYGDAKNFLEKGASVDAEDSCDGNTSLMYVAMWGTPQMAKLLIKYGADVNKEVDEITPFPRNNKLTAFNMAESRKFRNPTAEFNEAEFIIAQLKAAGAIERCPNTTVEYLSKLLAWENKPCRKFTPSLL